MINGSIYLGVEWMKRFTGRENDCTKPSYHIGLIFGVQSAMSLKFGQC